MKGLESLAHPEHMNDDEQIDAAEQFQTDLALLQHRQRTARDPAAVSLEWCDDCGVEIPEARRQAVPGVTLCIDCAKEEERRARRFA